MDPILLGTYVGIAVGLLAILRYLIPKCISCIKTLWQNTMGDILDKLKTIENELKPNGGSSLRDVVDSTRNRTERVYALYMAQLSTSNEAVFLADKHGEVYWTSPGFQRITGRTSSELLGRGWINIFPQRIRTQFIDDWYDHAIQENRNFEHCAQITNGPGGEELHVLITAVKMKEPISHEVLGYFGNLRVYDDIT